MLSYFKIQFTVKISYSYVITLTNAEIKININIVSQNLWYITSKEYENVFNVHSIRTGWAENDQNESSCGHLLPL